MCPVWVGMLARGCRPVADWDSVVVRLRLVAYSSSGVVLCGVYGTLLPDLPAGGTTYSRPVYFCSVVTVTFSAIDVWWWCTIVGRVRVGLVLPQFKNVFFGRRILRTVTIRICVVWTLLDHVGT